MFKDKNQQREFQRQWVAKRRAHYVEVRGGSCHKCGSTHLLEFHHRERDDKLDHKVWSWRKVRIEAELLKCDLLCHDCHAEETAKQRGYGLALHGTLTSYKRYGCRCEDCRQANSEYEHTRRVSVMSI